LFLCPAFVAAPSADGCHGFCCNKLIKLQRRDKLLGISGVRKHIIFVFFTLFNGRGTAVAEGLRCCATNRKVAGSIPAGVSGFLIDIKSFRTHYGSGVDSASNRNEYKEYFLGVKAAGA